MTQNFNSLSNKDAGDEFMATCSKMGYRISSNLQEKLGMNIKNKASVFYRDRKKTTNQQIRKKLMNKVFKVHVSADDVNADPLQTICTLNKENVDLKDNLHRVSVKFHNKVLAEINNKQDIHYKPYSSVGERQKHRQLQLIR